MEKKFSLEQWWLTHFVWQMIQGRGMKTLFSDLSLFY